MNFQPRFTVALLLATLLATLSTLTWATVGTGIAAVTTRRVATD